MINELAKQIHQNAKDKGFYDEGHSKNVGEKLMLIVSEVSEALEAHRCDKFCTSDPDIIIGMDGDFLFQKNFQLKIKNTFEDELADAVIRILDLSAWVGIDIEAHIKAKMRYNSLRERMHGKKY